MGKGVESAIRADFRNRVVGSEQQILCVFKSEIGKVLGNRKRGFRMEKLAYVVG